MTLPPEARDRLLELWDPIKGGRSWSRRSMPDEHDELDAYLYALTHKGGWTLQSISDVIGITRERVRQRVERAKECNFAIDYVDVPIYVKPVPVKEYVRPRPKLNSSQVRKLRNLHSMAKNLRGKCGDTSERRASEALSAYLNELIYENGYWTADVARAMGVKVITVRARLSRFGYRPLAPSQKPYQGLTSKS